MALEEYKRKRDFKRTSEPPPAKSTGREGFSYLIQKHDATRLHYDFRLELDGVLLSWAVTRGPSLNPADKRLAVRTEDHPLEYGKFEGTIPKGQYGGGTVMLWDRGTWTPKFDPHQGLKKGHLAFTLEGERLTGGWDLIRMHGDGKRENWLLIKEKDASALSPSRAAGFLDRETTSVATGRSMDEIAAGARSPAKDPPKSTRKSGPAIADLMKKYPEVELATLADAPPEGNHWLHEIKFDGYRLLAFVSHGEVRLRTRNGNDWTHKFPSIQAQLARLKVESAVLDMEAVVLDAGGKSSFQALQHALGEGGNSQTISAFVFDLLDLNGKDLTGEPLSARKKLLSTLLKGMRGSSRLRYSDHVVGHADQIMAQSCSMGLEGVVSKLADSPYRPGRQKSWVKSKCINRQEFVIAGFTAARTGPRAIGALHLGYNQKGKLKYAGKVGTGFTMSEARKLFERLAPLEIDKPAITDVPRSVLKAAHWVKPKLLCEVAFTEWTADGQLRHPSFQGLREDKPPRAVVMERPARLERADRAGKSNERLAVGGVAVSHPLRVIFKDVGVTKGGLAEYYAAVSRWILADLGGHPVSLLRCPEGTSGGCFTSEIRAPGSALTFIPSPGSTKGSPTSTSISRTKRA